MFKEEVEADKIRKARDVMGLEIEKTTALEKIKDESDYMDVPDVPEWGALRGTKHVKTTTANAYLNALQRRDAAEALKYQRQAVIDMKEYEKQRKLNDKDEQVDAWIDSFRNGNGVLGDAPPTLQGAIKAKADSLKINVPTRKLGEPTIEKLTDSVALVGKLDDLSKLESGYRLRAGQALTPDIIKNMIIETFPKGKLREFYKAIQTVEPAYFLFTSEVLKSVQGSRPSDFDMEVYLKNMPSIRDAPDVKADKIARLRKQLTRRHNVKVQQLQDSGFNMHGFKLYEEAVAPSAAAPAAAVTEANAPRANTQAEYDALPSGAVYWHPVPKKDAAGNMTNLRTKK